MVDATIAQHKPVHVSPEVSPELLRARAQRRRETAERLWDERLERLLLDEADDLERRAEALDLEAAIRAERPPMQATRLDDLAALRQQRHKRL